MFNLYDGIIANPGHYRQLNCGESLSTVFTCPIKNKYQDLWSHLNYFVCVLEGRKVWHTANGSYDLRKGSFVYVRKGACIIEQFFDATICIVLFFVTDDFLRKVLKCKSTPISEPGKENAPVITMENNSLVQAFFHSMMPYFDAGRAPDQALLELKFRELVLMVADNPANKELLSYFCSLLQHPQAISLQQVMEDNYCFNLKLEEFAQLSARSLSAFKRDFQRLYDTTPGQWLLEKRLNHAVHLLTNLHRTVSEAAFESGFENASHFSRTFRQRFGVSPATMKHTPATWAAGSS